MPFHSDPRYIDLLKRMGFPADGPEGTHHRATILQVLLGNSKPVTAQDVHYRVKAVNFNASFYFVYQTLTLLVKSGLAHEIIPDDGTARHYTHELAIAQCAHAHLVCRDCGMMVAGGE